jgi:competence protein ComEC
MLLAWRFTNRNAARVTMMLALLCGLLVLTGCRVHILEGQRSAASFQHAAQIGKHVTFTAQLVGFPERKRTAFGDREWVRVQAYAPTQPQPAGGTVPMLVWLSDIDSNWQDARWGPGTRVHITAKLKAQPSSDAAAYTANPLSVHEIGGAQQVVGVQSTDRIDTPTFTASVGAAAATFRTLLVQHASAVTGAELVPGFAVGDTSLVPESLNDTMLESSLSHLTAVSGVIVISGGA